MEHRTRKLNMPQRLLLAAVGLVTAGAGATAVFVTENGTGAAAMVAAGFLVLIIAVVGRIVGFKVAGAEATFGPDAVATLTEVEDRLEVVAASDSDEPDPTIVKDELDRALADLRQVTAALRAEADRPARKESGDRGLADHRRAAEDFGRSVQAGIAQLAINLNIGTVDVEGRVANGRVWDVVIQLADGLILVEARYVRSPAESGRPGGLGLRSTIHSVLGRAALEILADRDRLTRVLIVVPSHALPVGPDEGLTSGLPGVRVVGWQAGDQTRSDSPAAEALQELARIAPEGPFEHSTTGGTR